MSVEVFKKNFLNLLNGELLTEDLTFLYATEFDEESKKTDLYKQASLFYEKEFCESFNLGELIPDTGKYTPSYNSIDLSCIFSSYYIAHIKIIV